MALIQVSGYPAGAPSYIGHPLTGRPWADVTLGTPSVPWKAGDQVQLQIQDGPTYLMTVERVGPRGGFTSARLVGGNGGLSRDIEAKYYRDIPAEIVVRELLEACGEAVGDIQLPGKLPTWLRPAGPAHEALRAVMMRFPDRVWWLDFEGRVHAGLPQWPEYEQPVPVEQEDAASGAYICRYTPGLERGMHVTLTRGEEEIQKRVTRVTHSMTEHYDYPRNRLELRTTVGTGDGQDLGVAGLEAVVQRGTRWTDYCALYPCEVLRDHGDHTLDLRPEHPLMPEMTKVRLTLPIPGSRVKLRKGATVLLGFQAGDPARPVVMHYGDGTLERFEVKTGLGQTIVLDDDRGKVSPENQLYAQPRITVQDSAGQRVVLDPKAGTVSIRANTKVIVESGEEILMKAPTVNVQGSTEVNVKTPTANIDAGRVVLAGGGPAVARVGDQITASGVDSAGHSVTVTGSITSGSPKVVSG